MSEIISTVRFFKTWVEARDAAEKLAREVRRDVGYGSAARYGYAIRVLPNVENRYGWDLRCEVIQAEGLS